MRLSSSAIVLGAASSAIAQDQKVLGSNLQQPIIDAVSDVASGLDHWAKPLEKLLGEFTDEAQALWDEMTLLVPDAVEAFKKQVVDGTKPKKVNRRPDHEWDHIVKGEDVQSIWVEGADGEKHRQVGGRLENYNLRAKKVDPGSLGVDTVKQYSGYLDDEEEDKHLFYCMFEYS